MTPRILFVLAVTCSACAVDPPDVGDTAQELRAPSAIQTVDFPGATRTLLLGLDDFDRYVGLFVLNGPHAMWFDGHQLAALDPGGVVGTAPRSRAYALNNLGTVVGSYSDAGGNLHGFALCGDHVTTIDHPSGAPTEIYGIDDFGTMIGVSYDDEGNGHGFTLRGGTFADLAIAGSVSTVPLSISDRGDIVGEVVAVPGTIGHGFRKTRDGNVTLYDAPGAPADSTYFASINNLGQILGAYFDDAFEQHNFVLSRGVVTPVEVPGAAAVSAQTLNDRGHVVGYYVDAGGATHGFVNRTLSLP
jgi:uncharacterized membrane protein